MSVTGLPLTLHCLLYIAGDHSEVEGLTFCVLRYRCAAGFSHAINQAAASRQKHSLPDLTYDYGALEPHICAEIMQLHHSKHHATYVNNLNVTEEKYQEALAKGSMIFVWIHLK